MALMASWWLSVGLGAGLGLLYIGASVVVNRFAATRPGNSFLLIFVSGMMIRLAVALSFITVVLLLLPVTPLAFIGSFFAVFCIGLVLEVSSLHRKLVASEDAPQS